MSKLDWSKLDFNYLKTNYNVRSTFKSGKWGELEISESEEINLHIAATSLHYGQEIFEGLKAFRGKDNKIRIFRWQENAKRFINSARGILMQPTTKELFQKAICKAVQLNKEFVPPHGTGASLYIRPLLIGSGPQLGVKPATEYVFIVFVNPVGPYFKEGFQLTNLCISRKFDRTAPNGTGNIKVGGNYAAGLKGGQFAQENNCSAILYLDSRENKYIDECGPANFFAIKNKTYITPKSNSVLPSITNDSLLTLAKDIGLKVERRPILVEELETFEEVGACGTAAVISPIGQIIDTDSRKTYTYSKNGKPGKYSQELYNKLTSIQYGDAEDKYNWNEIIE